MKLLGRKVLLTIPKRPESVIELTPEVEKQLEADMIKQWSKLEVYKTSADVEAVKEGDFIYVSSNVLMNAERITIDEDVKMLINEYDISIVW
jgi:hypothetical protein